MEKEDFLLIQRMIRKEIEKIGFNKNYGASVVGVNGSLIDIQINGSDTTISNVKNKSGETLIVGDEVYVEAINNNFSNIVVKYKI